jgi:hypothetical protein
MMPKYNQYRFTSRHCARCIDIGLGLQDFVKQLVPVEPLPALSRQERLIQYADGGPSQLWKV